MLISNLNQKSQFTVSILNNTNRLVSSSQDNFGGVRQGSFIKLGDENILYQIAKIQKFYILKDFEVLNNKQILVHSNIDINLQEEDVLKIIYDEYQLENVLNIINAGKFYKKDEIIQILGGQLSIDVRSGMGSPIKFKIEELDEKAGIKKLSLIDKGKYIKSPPNKVKVLGSGEDAELELNYSSIDNRSILERTIKKIELKDKETQLILDYSLPIGIKSGKLSTEKWEILLSSNYLGSTLKCQSYQIYKDFTPNLNLPLMLKGSQSFDLIFNQAMNKIDSEIKAIKDKISN